MAGGVLMLRREKKTFREQSRIVHQNGRPGKRQRSPAAGTRDEWRNGRFRSSAGGFLRGGLMGVFRRSLSVGVVTVGLAACSDANAPSPVPLRDLTPAEQTVVSSG